MHLIYDIVPNALLWIILVIAIVSKRSPKLLRGSIAILALAAVPVVPQFLFAPLADVGSTKPVVRGETAVAVFGGGVHDLPAIGAWPGSDTVRRASAGLAAANRLGMPVMFSGGVSGRGKSSEAEALALRIPLPDDIKLDSSAETTHQNAAAFARFAKDSGWTHVLVATSPHHRRRAAATLRAHGLTVVGFADFDQNPERTWILQDFVPSVRGLTLWKRPSYEGAAILTYLWRGHIRLDDIF